MDDFHLGMRHANQPFYGSSIMSPHQDGSIVGRRSPLPHSNICPGQATGEGYAAVLVTPTPTATKVNKGVTFKQTATVRSYSPFNGSMTNEDKSKLYYSKHELNIFKLEVIAICTLSQGLSHIGNPSTLLAVARDSIILPEDNGDVDDNTTDTLRGLEILMYPKRHHNKVLAHRSLLKYQALLNTKTNVSSERKRTALAAASAKLNLWSSLVAAETARLDSIRAYEIDYMIPIDPPGPLAITPFPFRSKKQHRRGSRRITLDEDDTNGQSKRRKTDQ